MEPTKEQALLVLAEVVDAFIERHGCFPLDNGRWRETMSKAYRMVGEPNSFTRQEKVKAWMANP
jgi:hypothetical protein